MQEPQLTAGNTIYRSTDYRIIGRFAPSPTGALHTGSLVAAVGSYLMAKHAGGLWLLRLDDLDAQRQITGMADDIMRTLESFCLLWDGEVARQSCHTGEYGEAFEALQQAGVLYPCGCSRREIAMASSAPRQEDDCLPYPGTCRGGLKADSPIRSWRVAVPGNEICFNDLRKGRICQTLPEVSGDFAVRRGDGEYAYQLAVVVDDHLAGVTQVVRGEDLLASTPRQIYIQTVLGYQQPEYCHLPLVTGSDGAKLSKRDNLISYQLGNVRGGEARLLFAVLAFLGQNPPAGLESCSCEDLLDWGVTHFDAGRIPCEGGEIPLRRAF
ncbi:MAG: tRNA glutamyl-Q(34) synthetase GluQRS [Desulfuromonadaceae bacterium]|nr:tRNA glutamyl-Q(34) synthetase GluQRS [Desulfuromonadaceae bacterium]